MQTPVLRLEDASNKKRTPTCATPFENTESDLKELHGIDPKTNTPFHYKTLAHAWNAWYAPFFEEGNAFRWFFIRYEDMLLRTEEITRRVCDHFGSPVQNYTVRERTAKAHWSVHSLGYTEAVSKLLNPRVRVDTYTAHDLDLMREILDPSLLDYFRYTVPEF